MLDYLRIACKSPQLYKAMEAEYKRNFTWLLQGKFTTLEEHVRDYILFSADTVREAMEELAG